MVQIESVESHALGKIEAAAHLSDSRVEELEARVRELEAQFQQAEVGLLAFENPESHSCVRLDFLV